MSLTSATSQLHEGADARGEVSEHGRLHLLASNQMLNSDVTLGSGRFSWEILRCIQQRLQALRKRLSRRRRGSTPQWAQLLSRASCDISSLPTHLGNIGTLCCDLVDPTRRGLRYELLELLRVHLPFAPQSCFFLNMYTQLFEECHHSGDTFSLQRGELEASAELLDDACAFTMKDTTALRALFSGHVEGAPFISFPRTAVALAKVPTTSNPSIDLLESLLLSTGAVSARLAQDTRCGWCSNHYVASSDLEKKERTLFAPKSGK